MDKVCSKCGGDLIAGRLMTGVHLADFMPLGEEKKIRPTRARVLCDACSQCGAIMNIRVEEPEALR